MYSPPQINQLRSGSDLPLSVFLAAVVMIPNMVHKILDKAIAGCYIEIAACAFHGKGVQGFSNLLI